MTFKLSPAVFGKAPKYECFDEANCDEEAYMMCALQQSDAVDFLTCMDAAHGSADAKAKSCAGKAGLDAGKLSSCYKSEKATVLKAAAAHIKTKKINATPTVEINGKNIGGQSIPSYSKLLKALCGTGITAGACKGLDETEVEAVEPVEVYEPLIVV